MNLDYMDTLSGVTLPGGKTELKLDGSGTDKKSVSRIIRPSPLFVIKTKRIQDSIKLFVNVCLDECIAKPAQKKKLDKDGKEIEGLNLPVSVGPIRECLDKSGRTCFALDSILSPQVKIEIYADKTGSYRHFVCSVLIECVEQKYNDQGLLDRKYKLPRLTYFGYVDSRTGEVVENNSKQFAEVASQAVRDTGNLPVIEEIDTVQSRSVISSTKSLPSIKLKTYIGLTSGKQLDFLSFVNKLKTIVTNNTNNPSDMSDSSMPLAIFDSGSLGNLSLPLLLNADICKSLTVATITVKAVVESFERCNSQVEISAFTLYLSGLTFQKTEYTLPFCVLPHSAKCDFVEELNELSISMTIDSSKMENSPDIGTEQWRLVRGISSKTNREVEHKEIRSVVNENEVSSDKFSSVVESPCNHNETNCFLPEDKFHTTDVVSRHNMELQEEERTSKTDKFEKERSERTASLSGSNVEYLDIEDFKPGGKFSASTMTRVENTNNLKIGPDLSDIMFSKQKACYKEEESFAKYNSKGLSNKLWFILV